MSSDKTKRALPKERQHFLLLLLSNPNYFGNDPKSPFKSGVSKAFSNDTRYEHIRCVGFNPQFEYVEAVVDIKQDTGYSGGICATGSYEYVRFYADYTNTNTWTDLGFASVRVHDIPGAKPLSYTLRVPVIDPPRHYCTNANLVKIRAILSWSVPPPPDTPDYPPVWGQHVDVNVQIRPSYRRPWRDFIGIVDQKIEPGIKSFLSSVDLETELKMTPKKLDVIEKQKLYSTTNVPPHRFAFEELTGAAAKPLLFAAQSSVSLSDKLELSPGALDELLEVIHAPTHDATQYEEVTCVGYRPEDDAVGAVVTIKQSSGYSGSLCSTGSPEYVAFWADVSGWQFLGLTAVQVHDLTSVPDGGVQYAVNLPVDTTAWRQICASGAKVVKLRAVLSWTTPPSSTDPDATPFWGNKFDTHVQLRPGDPAATGIPQLLNISGYSVSSDPSTNEIDPATGLTRAGDAPFGGVLAIRGVLPGFKSYDRYYRIDVKRASAPDSSYTSLMNPVTLRIFQENGSSVIDCSPDPGLQFECFPVVTPADLGDGLGAVWYKYLNYESGGVISHIEDNTLGYWLTTPGEEGLWNIRVTFRDGLAETAPSAVTVCLDNTPPVVNASWSAAVEATCNKTTPGTTVVGSYTVSDAPGTPFGAPHLSAIRISVIPALAGAVVGFGTTVSGSPSVTRAYPVLPTSGETGDFAMRATTVCGYAVRFEAWDRTVVGYFSGPNFGTTNFSAHEDDLGICVEQ
ncbi:MAG TPA: hypothetical protein VGR95_15405 [Thermoanaerobaculia bacterium]|jgi:hypothetical protein|nr:hypothetical protein [Thermoanaerobaculia bacterium]